MKHSQRRPSIFSNIILFAGLVAAWIAFAPANIGGQASYVMVNGISMEPNYHTGDLVMVRKAQIYQIGDVVTYRDAEMGAYVIHRIIGIEQGQFIIKGDNNSWIDAYHPTHDEILGKQWIHAPKLGRTMQWFRRPFNLLVTVLLFGGVFMSSIIIKPAKGQKGNKSPLIRSGGMLEGALYLLGILFLGFLGLTIFSFIRPLMRTAEGISYQQDGSYSYSATGTPGVYDTEMVRSGEPVFPKLACFLNVGFTYNILGGQLQNMSGYHQMNARIMDQQSGWQRTIPMTPQTAFTGSSYFAMATLDLCQLEALVNMVEKETGFRTNTYTVEIITNITFTAYASGQVVTDTFDPTLTFKYDKVHLYLANTNQEIDPMLITDQELVGNVNLEANTLSLLGWKPTVSFIRLLALLGLGLSFCGLVFIGLSVFSTARQSADGLIRLRYGSMLMDVNERSLNVTLPMIDATSIDDLAKMAERQNTMILHVVLNSIHYYLVQGNGAIYRYAVSMGVKGVAAGEAAVGEVTVPTAPKNKPGWVPEARRVNVETNKDQPILVGNRFIYTYPPQKEIPGLEEIQAEPGFHERIWTPSKPPEYVIDASEAFEPSRLDATLMHKVRL